MQGDQLFKEAETPILGPYVNYIPTRPIEYEYEYDKYQWIKFTATIIPEEPKIGMAANVRNNVPCIFHGFGSTPHIASKQA
jgi:hypothetical protein